MACKYIYKGNEYTRGQILDQIMKGGLSLQVLDQQKARETIKRITGMTDAQIEFVKGLIDGKALGRMLSDGNILLSEMSSESTAYHEAFHRVWQGSLTSEERSAAIKEFKTNKNWERLIEPYRASYGDDVDVLIEEYFADEFANFVLGEPTPKTFLQKLFAQLKKMLDYLGLTKPSEINRIYDLMNKGAYASRQVYEGFRQADQIVINHDKLKQIKMTSDDYMSVVEAYHLMIMQEGIRQGNIEAFLSSDKFADAVKINHDTLKQRILDNIINAPTKEARLLKELKEKSGGVLNTSFISPKDIKDIYNENRKAFDLLKLYFAVDFDLSNPSTSQIMQKYREYAKTLFKVINFEKTKEDPADNDENDDKKPQEEESEGSVKEIKQENPDSGTGSLFERVVMEIDPNSTMSSYVRLMLSSLSNPNDVTLLGLPRSYNWVAFANFLNNNLANLPATEEAIFDKLKKLQSNNQYGNGITQLINLLGGERVIWRSDADSKVINSRIKFIGHFSQNKYNFYVSTFTKDNIYSFDSSKVSTKEKIKAGISTNFIISFSEFNSPKAFLEELKKRNDAVIASRSSDYQEKMLDLVRLFGLEEEYDVAKTLRKEKEFAKTLGNISEVLLKTKQQDQPGLIDAFSKKSDSVDIQGYVKELVEIVEQGSKSTELSVLSATGEKLYAISLNSYMTQVINEINYALDEIENEKPNNKKAALFQKVPQLNTFYGQKSLWVDRLLEKNARLKLIVNDGLRTEKSKIQESLSDQEETALLTTYLNQLLDPVSKIWQTVKHSDRSTLYAIAFENSRDAESMLDYDKKQDIDRIFGNYLEAEVDKMIALKNGVGRDVQYYKDMKGLFSKRVNEAGVEVSIVTDEMFEDLIKSAGNRNSKEWKNAKQKALAAIKEAVEAQSEYDYNYLKKWGVLRMQNGKPVGVSKEIWENEYKAVKEKYEALAQKVSNETIQQEAIRRISDLYSINTLIGNIEQTILITGDPDLYKNSVDSFKRFSVWSSTGNLAVHGDMAKSWILGTEQKLKIKVGGKLRPYFKGKFSSDPDFISTRTYAEEEYMMQDTFLESLKLKSYNSLYQVLINIGYSEQEAKERAEKQSEDLKEKYARTNEPDGQSWMNLFEWRRTKITWQQWSDAHEELFMRELRIFNGETQAVYDIPKGLSAEIYFNEFLGLAETMKGQYAGPYWNQESTTGNGINVQGVAKTSFYPLLPSQIVGTKLEDLNRRAVENGDGVIHVASARKVGVRLTLNEKNQPRNDEFYLNGLPKAYTNDGKLNYEKLDFEGGVQFMQRKYFKHQVKIHNYEKENIVSASQSHKLNLSNLMQHGVPIDYKGSLEEWYELSEDEKQEVSEIYKNIGEYTKIAEERMINSINDLQEELQRNGDDITKRLVDLIKETLKKRDTTTNVLDALDLFADAEIKVLEIIPNRNRIEPIMYSLIKNNVLTQRRNGNSVPQVSSLFWEAKNKNRVSTGEKNKKGNVEASDELKMYEGDNAYAEIIMPLPIKWIDALMKAYKTRDVMSLVNRINDDIKKGDFTRIDEKMLFLKGFRIPNQQLSSNDVFRIKRFVFPSNTAMVIVPPAIAVKVGSDFDIDKLNMYMPHGQLVNGSFKYLTSDVLEESMKKEEGDVESMERKVQENKLLEIEMNLMAMPINFMNLMKPTLDTQWEDARTELKAIAEKKIKEHKEDKKLVELFSSLFTKPVSLFNVYTASTNVEKTRENIGSKGSVGQAAKAITNHAVSQLNDFRIRMEYMDGKTPKSRAIPFLTNDNGRIGKIFSEGGDFISDLYSGLLTIQVDAVKDPKAKALGLVTQTMNMANYLLKRGANPEDIVFFLSQPVIRDYIKKVAMYQSAAYIESGQVSSMRDAAKKAYSETKDDYMKYKNKDSKVTIMQAEIKEKEKFVDVIKSFDLNYQIPLLNLFMDLMDQTQDDLLFIGAVGIDTFKPKSMADILDKEEKIEKAMSKTGLIENLEQLYGHPLIRPFKTTMDLYSELYSQYYLYINQNTFPYFKNRVDWSSKTVDKIKLMKVLPEDFVTFLVQNNESFKPYPFEKIMAGNQSLARQIKDFKSRQKEIGYSYRVLDALVPKLFATDALNGVKLSHLKKMDFGENPFQIEEYANELEEIRELDPDLYNNLVAYTIYTYGYSSSIYSLDRFMPVKQQKGIDTIGRYQLAQEALKEFFNRSTPAEKEKILKAFLTKFDMANPMLLKPDRSFSRTFENTLAGEFDKGKRDLLMFRKFVNGKLAVVAYNQNFGSWTAHPNGGFGYKLYNGQPVAITAAVSQDYQYDDDIDETNPEEYMSNIVKETAEETSEVKVAQPVSTQSKVDPNRPEFSKLPQKSATPTMTYAGIGSRETPQKVLSKMTEIANYLDGLGYTLQTGFTFKDKDTGQDEEGADKAFSDGSKNKILFGPYGIRKTVNEKTSLDSYNSDVTIKSNEVVKEIHPAPEKLSPGALKLMARNTNQIFGKDLDSTVDFVIFYAPETNNPLRPKGGTGQAVEMARRKGIPTINMANENWREELDKVLSTQPLQIAGKPKGQEIKEGVFVNQEGLTKEEQLELFDYLKPYFETQGAKTNKSVNANKMIGLGLRWDYKSNNSGISKMYPELGDRNPVDVGTNLAGRNTLYGYYNKSINGLELGKITPRFRELISKATGIDISNYDGAIINLYDENTFIGNHSDLEESASAEKYPVVAVNIGGSGNFTAGTSPSDNINLKPGAGYSFGFEGKNRRIAHSTRANKQDGFLPELTTKLDGRTYPAGSYRITITMRRVMPLQEGMPTSPKILSTQPTAPSAAPSVPEVTKQQPVVSETKETPTKKYTFEYNGVSIDTDFQLSQDQEEALETLIDFYDNKESAIMLQGAAGTGKTSIIGYLQKYLSKKNGFNEPILYSAPTHAATVELGFATVKTGNTYLPLTVASMKKYDRISQNYSLSNKASGIISGGKIIVVDESSMLSSRDYNEIINIAKGGLKVIFLGDKKQIPEVIASTAEGDVKEKAVSKAFTEHQTINLDTIHRTSNPDIKNILQKIRDSKSFQLYKTKENTENLMFYNNETPFKRKLLQTVVSDPQNTDYIGYTNVSVSNMNKMIREKAFGRTGELQPGDIIMGYLGYASKQIAGRPEVAGNLANSVTYKIDSVEIVKELNYSGDLKYTGYFIKASSERLLELRNRGMSTSERAETTYLPLSSTESIENKMTKEDYDKNNEYLSKQFKALFDFFQRLKDNNFSARTKEEKQLWKSYFDQEGIIKIMMAHKDLADNYIYNYKTNRLEKENLSDSQKELKKYYGSQAQAFKIEKGIDFGHAITIHKSQGRTTKNVFFDANTLTSHDIIIKENGKQISTERQSLGYVAMSRASQNLFVYEGSVEGVSFEEIDNAAIDLFNAAQEGKNDSIQDC